MAKKKKKQQRFPFLMAGAMLLAVALVSSLAYYLSPSSRLSRLLPPPTSIGARASFPDSRQARLWTLTAPTLTHCEPRTGLLRCNTLSVEQYGELYESLQGAEGVRSDPALAARFEGRGALSLRLPLQPQGKISGARPAPHYELQVASSGDLFRVCSPKSGWVYYELPGLRSTLMQFS